MELNNILKKESKYFVVTYLLCDLRKNNIRAFVIIFLMRS